MSGDKPEPIGNPARWKMDFYNLLKRAEAAEDDLTTPSRAHVTKPRLAGGAPRTFLDTNILVYADDRNEPTKARIALDLIKAHLEARDGVVSLQVLQEYFVTVTRKLKLDSEIARNKVIIYSKFFVAEPTVADILAAIDMHRLHGFSYWDALVVRMAKQSGCRVILSEDMQCGRRIDGMEIVNPFLPPTAISQGTRPAQSP